MKLLTKILLFSAICAMALAVTSCEKEPQGPSQQEIESKLPGKWKLVSLDGREVVTNHKSVCTYEAGGRSIHSASGYIQMLKNYVWFPKQEMKYSLTGNQLVEGGDAIERVSSIKSIDSRWMKLSLDKYVYEGAAETAGKVLEMEKISADYSKDVIGLWEGVEVTGEETYGGAEARIEFAADGSYTYYVKENGYWIRSSNVDNEYFVDGDWLAARWRMTEGEDYTFEWWDIESVTDTQMKWSALREKGDGTCFTTTFTWKKVTHRLCEIGNTGKVVSSCDKLSGKEGSSTTLASNMTFWYCPDCSRITAYDLSDGIPGILMKDYSYVLHGDAVVDNNGEVIFNGITFNDKGYISHLVDFTNFSRSEGTTHVTYDIVYNDEDRMSKIIYKFLDADEKTTRIQNIDLLWEGGLLKSVKFDNNGEVSTTTYEYGNQANVHRQPSASFFNSLNMLTLDVYRPFLAAGYFGKGPDRFEVSSSQPGSVVAENSTFSVELDAEGKIKVLHEAYGEGSYTDYTFTYSDINNGGYDQVPPFKIDE